MTTTDAQPGPGRIDHPRFDAERARRRGPSLWADSVTIIWRNLITIKRVPELLVFSTIQPVICQTVA